MRIYKKGDFLPDQAPKTLHAPRLYTWQLEQPSKRLVLLKR